MNTNQQIEAIKNTNLITNQNTLDALNRYEEEKAEAAGKEFVSTFLNGKSMNEVGLQTLISLSEALTTKSEQVKDSDPFLSKHLLELQT